jgi:hypothetical protein
MIGKNSKADYFQKQKSKQVKKPPYKKKNITHEESNSKVKKSNIKTEIFLLTLFLFEFLIAFKFYDFIFIRIWISNF